MAYNLTDIGNVTNILELTQNVNTGLMEGWLGALLLIGIGIICFSGMMWSTRDTKNSLIATSFVMFLLGTLHRAMDLIHNTVLFITLIGMALIVAFSWRR